MEDLLYQAKEFGLFFSMTYSEACVFIKTNYVAVIE